MEVTDKKQVELHPEKFAFAGTGEVYSFTTLTEPPEGFEDQAPYTLALIRLDEGPLVTAQLTDLDEPPAIGDRVEMVTRKLTTEGPKGMIIYGYKFRKRMPRSE
ncbi:MAG: OB-fold domain-containing protein [Anaerolineae bacterium]|nr:OB-fold domain-containing protein [Anaerolineae bacterium]